MNWIVVALALGADIDPQHREEAPDPPKQPALTKAPELLNAVDAVYPDAAKAAGRTGEVVMMISIDAAGAVIDVVITQSAGDDLDQAAIEAARQFAFSPAEFDGVPGPVAIEYRTVFALEEVEEVEPAEPPPPAPAVTFIGVVRESGTKDPLEGVEVSVDGVDDAVITDAAGRFTFTDVPPGDRRVTFAMAGYNTGFIDESFVLEERTEAIVYLEKRDGNLFETTVRHKRAQSEVSKIELSREEVKRVPGTFGDPLRVIENLPGMARAPFGGGQLLIRGANPEDSGVYFDGVPIPILYHFQGLKSVVNAEFLESIDFQPGGFGAAYGRATAGIVDVQSRKLSMKSFRGAADVNLMDAGFFFAQPIEVGALPTVTVAAAARRSYIDAILPVVLDAIGSQGGAAIIAVPVYWDYQAKIETSPLPHHTLSLFVFGSDDDLKVEATGIGPNVSVAVGTHTTFHRVVGRWTWKIASGVTHVMQPFIGTTTQTLNAQALVDASINAEVWSWGIRDELRLKVDDAILLRGGLDYLGQTAGVNLSLPLPTEVGSFPSSMGGFGPGGGVDAAIENSEITSSGYRHAPALWAEAQLDLIPGLKVVPGVRAELLRAQFDPQVQDDGTATQGRTVDIWTIDPRLTVRWDVLPTSTVKGAIGIYHGQPNDRQLSPIVSDSIVGAPRSIQSIAGIEQRLTDDLHLDVQGYYIARDQLIEQSTDARTRITTLTNDGTGFTYGAELLLRHDITKHFYGWIAYTLSRTEVDTDPETDDTILSENDQTHILTIVAQGNLPWGFSLGARFRYVTGNPTTLPVGSLHDLDTTRYAIAESSNTTRLDAFHQLDVRLDKKWTFEQLSMTTYIDVINVYNAQNAEGYIEDFRGKEKAPITSLPILPIIGVSGEF